MIGSYIIAVFGYSLAAYLCFMGIIATFIALAPSVDTETAHKMIWRGVGTALLGLTLATIVKWVSGV